MYVLYTCSTRHTPGVELPSEGLPLQQVSLKLVHEVILEDTPTCLCPIGGQLVVSTGHTLLYRLGWEGQFDKSLIVDLKKLTFVLSLYPENRGK